MGKAIEEIATSLGHSISIRINSQNAAAFNSTSLTDTDVAIEFSNPHSALTNLYTCIDAGVPVVCGSTGWLDHWADMGKYCNEKNGTVLYASNFSIGVNIFFEVNRKLAAFMATRESYDVRIEEIHHTKKLDMPSGTAISLAEQVLEFSKTKRSWVNHHPQSKDELEIISRRIDPAPGTHSVKYHSAIDDIEITHTAHSRAGFANGAVLAAAFLIGKKGIFQMKDVIDL